MLFGHSREVWNAIASNIIRIINSYNKNGFKNGLQKLKQLCALCFLFKQLVKSSCICDVKWRSL
jgi:hypothetical protein